MRNIYDWLSFFCAFACVLDEAISIYLLEEVIQLDLEERIWVKYEIGYT